MRFYWRFFKQKIFDFFKKFHQEQLNQEFGSTDSQDKALKPRCLQGVRRSYCQNFSACFSFPYHFFSPLHALCCHWFHLQSYYFLPNTDWDLSQTVATCAPQATPGEYINPWSSILVSLHLRAETRKKKAFALVQEGKWRCTGQLDLFLSLVGLVLLLADFLDIHLEEEFPAADCLLWLSS